MVLVWEDGNLLAYQISMRYLNPRLRYNYFRFRKTNGRHFGFLFQVSTFHNFRHRRVILHWPTIFPHNRKTLGGVMTSIKFLKMAAGSHIGFDLDNIRPPTKCNCWSKVGPQIWS